MVTAIGCIQQYFRKMKIAFSPHQMTTQQSFGMQRLEIDSLFEGHRSGALSSYFEDRNLIL
eukprot:UN07794